MIFPLSTMSRSYTIQSLTVLPHKDDHSDVVITINFTYGDAELSLPGSCSLPAPGGDFIPLANISKEQAMGWLLEFCPNSTEEFDARLDAQAAAALNQPFTYDWGPVLELTGEPEGATEAPSEE